MLDLDPGVVQAIKADQESKSLQDMKAIAYDEAVIQRVDDQLEGGGQKTALEKLLEEKDKKYQELIQAKVTVDSLQQSGNQVLYFLALEERQKKLESMEIFLEKEVPDGENFSRKERKEWKNRYAVKWNNLLRAIKGKVLENKKALESYIGPNVETGSESDLVSNKDFADMFPEGDFQTETMRDFLPANTKNSEYLRLKTSEDETEQKLAGSLFNEMQANMEGEIIGQSNLLIYTIKQFAEEHLTNEEAKIFTEDLKVLEDKESSLDDKIKGAERITNLMKQYLLYVGGIDVQSGEKVYLALRNSEDVIRTEFEAFMKINGQDSTQMMTFYGTLPVEGGSELFMIENEFTQEGDENLTNDHFNKTQLELPFYAKLKDLFEKRSKEFTKDLNTFEKEALRVVRQLHNVVAGLKAYKKMEENLKE